ncbi:MAG: FxsA family protein, partial [Pseudohongiellaceae bacterium]
MRFLFLIFIIVPITEMLLLFEVADHIGAWYTLGLVVLTAVIGIQVLKQQGLSTLTRANQRIESGELPAQEMIEGIFLAVGGAFLLTPGFITDTLGFMFLIGPIRRLLVQALIKSGKLTILQAGGQR